ncbi:MAG: ABC transporter permease [Vicinamibacteria bacterium]|nr:ABC transporter permease [Vicinamibacteria bacterium]
MGALLQMIVKEFLQLRQDRKIIPALIIGPLAQLLALGYAANLDVTHVPLLVVDRDHSVASRALIERFDASGYFEIKGSVETADQAEPWLVEGRAQVVLIIPEGYGNDLAAHRSPNLQVLADGTDANSAVVGLGYASRIIAEMGGTLQQTRLDASNRRRAEEARRTGSPPVRPPVVGRIELIPRIFYNPDLKTRWFYVPAVLAMVLMLVTMMLPSMAVVREKEIGTLEQISVTPLRPWQLILGKLTPFAIIGMLDSLVIVMLAQAVFGVPLRGSLFLLMCLTLLFLLNTLGLGLLASTMVGTQQQAMMFSTFVLMVPMIYLSGLIFPIENMPWLFQVGSLGIPVRYYAIILRGIFLKGSGLEVLWPEALTLALTGLAWLTFASARFRKRLD